MRRSVLVTGASSGIGLATALHLARQGFHTLASVRSEDTSDRVRRAAHAAGVEVEVLAFDVTDTQACEEALAGLELYGLVNNAGFFNAGAVEDIDDEAARHQLETMVIAPMRLARLALPAMRAAGEGRIVNVTSAITLTSAALTGWYQASKNALGAVSDALRIEVADDGIEVVAIEPGGIDTEIWSKAEHDLMRRRDGSALAPAYDRALKIVRTLEGRMAPAAKVAEVIGEALTVGSPQERYRVGADTVVLTAAHALLPVSVKDRLVRTILNL